MSTGHPSLPSNSIDTYVLSPSINA
uniref:Uncharacterized protein n=1 Tax=Arundo donax TaxID=35708 RepID=A0A0A9ATQ6_ARUDO